LDTRRPLRIRGRVWVLTDPSGRLWHNIDTDMIFHSRHLHLTELAEMGQHTLGNLPGWSDFGQRARPGDIVVAGRNFGAGSSRQQAVDCFRALGIAALLAESFGAIYKRNAINAGLAILTWPGLSAVVERGELTTGDEVQVDLETGEVWAARGSKWQAEPFSHVQLEIYQAGDLFAYGQQSGAERQPVVQTG